jgi:hypothetical protein
MEDLYRVYTVVKKYSGCRDVVFDWFRCETRGNRDYASLISNYDPSDPYQFAEGAIDQMFTQSEASQLKEYLDQHHGDVGTTFIEKAKLPIAANTMGAGSLPVGGETGYHCLHWEPEYSLPIKVEGYFDLRHCELVDEPGKTFMGDVFIPRRETQQEARLPEAKERG